MDSAENGDLHCYRVMVIEEYFAGDIPQEEMRQLLADDVDLDLMFRDHIEMLERKADSAGMRVIRYSVLATVFYFLATLILLAIVP
jgi:hypothetical protein